MDDLTELKQALGSIAANKEEVSPRSASAKTSIALSKTASAASTTTPEKELKEMDPGMDGRMMEDEEVEKPDNLVWIENVILSNLELDPQILLNINQAQMGMGQQQTPKQNQNQERENNEHIHHLSEEPRAAPAQTINKEDLKILIAEIEMRDENYFGDDRVPTLSRILGCRIKYIIEGDDEERNHFWIIKVPPILPQDRDVAKTFGVARREIFFYTEILPALRMWVDIQYIDHLVEFCVPACYFGKYIRVNDPFPDMELIDHIPEAESLLVLEDLRAAEFGKRHFGKGMEISEVFAAVAEITKFHAVSYAMQKKSGDILGWGELLHWSNFVELYEKTFQSSFPVFENFMRNRSEVNREKILATMASLRPSIADIFTNLVKPTPDFPITLVHMDLWSENVMLRVKEEDSGVSLDEADLDCFILDWQMISLGKPTHDLALLVVLSMDATERQEHSISILQYYYQLFEKTLSYFDLEMPFSYASLISEFQNSCVLAVLMAMCSMDLILMEESTQQRLVDVINDLVEDGLLPR